MSFWRRLGFDFKLNPQWPRYVLQSFYATIAILIVILVFHVERAVTITSLAATCFIIFAMPKSFTARPRSILGGHMIGLLSGLAFSFVPQPHALMSAVVYALAIGVTVFSMVATNTEHPPAAGTAFAVVMIGWQPSLLVSIILSVIILAAISRIFGPRLLNLV